MITRQQLLSTFSLYNRQASTVVIFENYFERKLLDKRELSALSHKGDTMSSMCKKRPMASGVDQTDRSLYG